ncbi:hypothetical protein C8J57DRAFT_694920 [Mycena rebaudengoi]|nr:hypothetical protein C8J57DRAFT_694920 [Mycena rebaudengoi]
MSSRRSSTSEAGILPPINVLFAEVLQRQLALPSESPAHSVRHPSAWPGFPGPDMTSLLSAKTGGHHDPPPPLQIGRPRSSAPTIIPLESSSTPIFPSSHTREGHLTRVHSSHRLSRRSTETQRHQSPDRDVRWSAAAQTSQPFEQYHPVSQGWARARDPSPPRETSREAASGSSLSSSRPYDRDTPRPPRKSDPGCYDCAMDQHIRDLRAAVRPRGPIFPESTQPRKQQIPTPLPPAHGHTMIPFQPIPSSRSGRMYGVSMADILDFRHCLQDPDSPVLDNGVSQVLLTLEAKGYPTYVTPVSANCAHRRITRFNLAFGVASAFDTFLREHPFDPSGLKAAATVVRSVTELRLVNLYTRDGRVWRVHVAYVV